LREVFADLPDDAFELARFWMNDKRSFVAVARPKELNPELLGYLLVECLHTAATAYAQQSNMPEEEALKRIWAGIDEERERLSHGD